VAVPEIVLVMVSAVTTVLLQETLKAGNLRRTQANLITLGDEIFRVAVANVAQRVRFYRPSEKDLDKGDGSVIG
jgi:hypothetical protein